MTQTYTKKRYSEYKARNYLTQAYIKARNGADGDIKFGTIAEACDDLTELQTNWLISLRQSSDESIAAVAGRCIQSAYATEQMPLHLRQWLAGQADNIGASIGDVVVAILEDVYQEDMGDE